MHIQQTQLSLFVEQNRRDVKDFAERNGKAEENAENESQIIENKVEFNVREPQAQKDKAVLPPKVVNCPIVEIKKAPKKSPKAQQIIPQNQLSDDQSDKDNESQEDFELPAIEDDAE